MKNLTIFEIVQSSLAGMGYDGLYNDSECACTLDDLMPCDQPETECRAGYKTTYGKDNKCPCDLNCDYHIGPEKPK